MAINKQKNENVFGWLLFSVVMLMKICSIVTLCAVHKEHLDHNHDLHSHSTLKDKKQITLKPKA